MSRRCEICDKGQVRGNSILRRGQAKKKGGIGQHVTAVTPRLFKPNLQTVRAVIDGDALCYVVSCASIVAKVARDRLMAKLAVRYPGYGWEHNAGYATADHRAGMQALGVTPRPTPASDGRPRRRCRR